MADFNQCINDLEFLDPPLSGAKVFNHNLAQTITPSYYPVEEGFIDKVKEWWSSFNATGRPDSQLASKLSQLKVKLKEWSKANRNNWKERKDLILSQVGNLESIPGSQTFD
ncbi:hypothetical protein KY285_018328 [Solanum tuberosum]|nr:hypothetical protein KY284_018326 [Solanum tuberosum]KAH0704050.1 hypothetical protein KY285_018328 [Solanum tuberosum]